MKQNINWDTDWETIWATNWDMNWKVNWDTIWDTKNVCNFVFKNASPLGFMIDD